MATLEDVFFIYLTGFHLGLDFRTAAINWGVKQMQEGCVDKYTVLLASADSDTAETLLTYFYGAVKEANINLPDKTLEAAWLERYICKKIVAGEMNVFEGVFHLSRLDLEGLPDTHYRWKELELSVSLLRDYGPGFGSFSRITDNNAEETIKAEAARVLREKYPE